MTWKVGHFNCQRFPEGEILNDMTTLFGNRVCSLIETRFHSGGHFESYGRDFGAGTLNYFF